MPGVLRWLVFAIIFVFIISLLYYIVTLLDTAMGVAINAMSSTTSFNIPSAVFGLSNVPYYAIYAGAILLVVLIIVALMMIIRGEH